MIKKKIKELYLALYASCCTLTCVLTEFTLRLLNTQYIRYQGAAVAQQVNCKLPLLNCAEMSLSKTLIFNLFIGFVDKNYLSIVGLLVKCSAASHVPQV